MTRRPQVLLATAVVLIAVIAVSAAAVIYGQSKITAASRALTLSASATPAATSASPTPSPYPTDTGRLIGPEGSTVMTREQLHAFLTRNGPVPDDPANAAIGEQQAWLDMQCMADHGYLYDPTRDGTFTVELGKDYGLTPEQRKGYDLAFWGPDSSGPYDWRTAGCHGRSVHLTGQDDAH